MLRALSITFPDNTGYHNLLSLIVGSKYAAVNGGTDETGVVGAIPADGVFPSNVAKLSLTTLTGVTLTIADRNFANTQGTIVAAAATFNVGSGMRNTIFLGDYLLKASATTAKGLEVVIEAV
jgi:uncharacterized protein YjbI with pentapeptide repeats